MVTVAVTGEVPGFKAVNDGRFPVPDAVRPIDVLLLVHAYVVIPPVLTVVKVTGEVTEPLQTNMSTGLFT